MFLKRYISVPGQERLSTDILVNFERTVRPCSNRKTLSFFAMKTRPDSYKKTIKSKSYTLSTSKLQMHCTRLKRKYLI